MSLGRERALTLPPVRAMAALAIYRVSRKFISATALCERRSLAATHGVPGIAWAVAGLTCVCTAVSLLRMAFVIGGRSDVPRT